MFVHISLLWEDLHPFEMQVCRLAGTAGLYYFLFGQRSIEKIRKIIPLLCIGSISLSAFLLLLLLPFPLFLYFGVSA